MIKKIIKSVPFLYKTALYVYNYGMYFLNKMFFYAPERVRFRLNHGYALSLRNPKTFSEKVIHKKIYDRRNLLPLTADKYKVREYIKKILDDSYLIPLLHVTNNVETIPFKDLPKDYVIKANHGSGWNIIVRDGKVDEEKVKKKCKTWLTSPFGLGKLEWAYHQIDTKMILEELLTDDEGKVPKDYKFFVFKGKCKMVQVDMDRFKNHKRSIFDENWKYLDASLKYPQGPKLEKPHNFKEMKQVAEKLGKEFDFVRVDLYSVGKNI